MGYYLRALIGGADLMHRASEVAHEPAVDLAQGLALVPITDAAYDGMGGGGDGNAFENSFYYLSNPVEELAVRLSAQGPVAYVEVEFFGGVGTQAAVLWEGGSVACGPLYQETDGATMAAIRPVNRVLRLMGVRARRSKDEFAVVGLNRHRDMDDWVRSASPGFHPGPLT